MTLIQLTSNPFPFKQNLNKQIEYNFPYIKSSPQMRTSYMKRRIAFYLFKMLSQITNAFNKTSHSLSGHPLSHSLSNRFNV